MTGIYKITCTGNNKVYVGQSVAIKRRWREHQKALKNGSHYNKYLQRAYDKYGEQSFVYEILEQCPSSKLNEREAFYIYFFNSFKDGFNCDLGGSNISGEANPMYGMSGQNSPRYIDQVLQLDAKGHIVATYDSANLAAKTIGGQAGHINECLHSWRKHSSSAADVGSRERFTHKGFYWIYKNDYKIFEENNYDFSQKRNKNSPVLSDWVDKGTLDGDI